jgi:hypothetical protein
MPRLIGLAGLAGSGKSTAAEALVRELGGVRIPFAEALRRIVDGAGVCPPEAIRDAKDGKHFGTFEWSLTDTAYAFGAAGVSRHSRGKHHVAREFPTGRALLQWVGTDLLRTADPDVWIKLHADAVARSAAQIGARIVVADDCRFPNERQYIRDAGGLLIRLRRTDQEAAASSHPSENSLGEDAEYDEVIELPFGSVEELQATVVNVVRREWPSVLGQDDTTVEAILGWADDYAAGHATISREILEKHVQELAAENARLREIREREAKLEAAVRRVHEITGERYEGDGSHESQRDFLNCIVDRVAGAAWSALNALQRAEVGASEDASLDDCRLAEPTLAERFAALPADLQLPALSGRGWPEPYEVSSVPGGHTVVLHHGKAHWDMGSHPYLLPGRVASVGRFSGDLVHLAAAEAIARHREGKPDA